MERRALSYAAVGVTVVLVDIAHVSDIRNSVNIYRPVVSGNGV